MALAVGDRVRPKLTSSTLSGTASRLQPQPPHIGVVTRIVAGPPNMIFATFADTGLTFTINASSLSPNGVREDALDPITAPSDLVRNTYIDKVVVGLKSDALSVYSSFYVGKVVDVYNVSGVATVLVRTSLGMYYELPITRISIVPNR